MDSWDCSRPISSSRIPAVVFPVRQCAFPVFPVPHDVRPFPFSETCSPRNTAGGGGFIHFLFRQMRRADADVTGGEFGFLGQLFQFLDNRRAFRQPQRHARPDVFRVQREQPHLLADLAMVAAFGLLDHLEIFFQLGLVLERRAVDALELRILLVALVIGAGHGGELVRADVAGAHHVRPGAQVNEIAALVIRDRLAFGNVCEVADFEFARIARTFAERAEPAFVGIFQRLLARDGDFLESVVRLDFLFHLLLDLREIFRRDAVRQFDVVVKAVFHRRAGGKLGVGPEPDDGGGHDVGGGVPEALQIGHFLAVV